MMRVELKKRIVKIIAMLTLVAMAAGSFAVSAYADDSMAKQGSQPANTESQDGEALEDEAGLADYANEVLGDYDAKAETEEVDMEELLENSHVNGEDIENAGLIEEDEVEPSEEEKALKEAEEKYEKALTGIKLSGKIEKDFAKIVESQVGREGAWKVDFVGRLMELAGVTDIKTKAKTVDSWIEEIGKAESASLETIKSNAEKAAKGVESEPVKLVSYTPFEDKDLKASDLVFFAENENGEVVYKVGVYSDKNFSKTSKGNAPAKGKAVLITGDSQGNVVEETFTLVKGIDKDYNELQVQPAEKKAELEKSGEDLSKMAFIGEKEIVIDGVVSLEAEKVAIKAAQDKVILKDTGAGSIVTVKLKAAAFGGPVDDYTVDVREIVKGGDEYNNCLAKARAEGEKDLSVKEVVEGRFYDISVYNGAGEKVNPLEPIEIEVYYEETVGLTVSQMVKAIGMAESVEVTEVAINEAPLTEEILAKEAALMEEFGEDQEEEKQEEEKVEEGDKAEVKTENAEETEAQETAKEVEAPGESIKSIAFATQNTSIVGMVTLVTEDKKPVESADQEKDANEQQAITPQIKAEKVKGKIQQVAE